MPIIINDVTDTTGPSSTVSIPVGQHDYMLINFAAAYNEDYSTGGGDSIPVRQTPSGGGGTWISLGNVYGHLVYLGGEGLEYINQCLHAWYSYPTSTGDVSISVGSALNDTGKRDIFYSLSNAKYYDVETYTDLAVDELYDNATFSKQGSSCFGSIGSIIKSNYLGLQGMLNGTTFDKGENVLVKDGQYDYTFAFHNRHKRYHTSVRFEQTGMYNYLSAKCGIFVSVDTVECL